MATLAVLFTSSVYFSVLAGMNHGLKDIDPSFLDALYFSFVTFTSLGYGEYVPQGFGRVVAIVDVVSGLALTALLIGKFASERQSAILVLLHTSDCQRRISGFSLDLQRFNNSIADLDAAAEQKKVLRALRDLQQLMEAISNYLIFNAMQARIVEFGNSAGLSTLYRQLEETFAVCEAVVREANVHGQAPIMNRAFAACGRIRSLLSYMRKLHVRAAGKHGSINSFLLVKARLRKKPFSEPDGAAKAAALLEDRLNEQLAQLSIWKSTTLNPELTEQVFRKFPIGPKESWGKSVHKTIAKDIGVSNSLVAKTINKLIDDGRLPKSEPKMQKKKRESRSQRAEIESDGYPDPVS
ncbi:potassium channel family protein [Sinorhizobium saheli]|nr:potassium channel family protein [Sinorhizobium saheli]